jgi:hypothetical protein
LIKVVVLMIWNLALVGYGVRGMMSRESPTSILRCKMHKVYVIYFTSAPNARITLTKGQKFTCRVDNLVDAGNNRFRIVDAKSSVIQDPSPLLVFFTNKGSVLACKTEMQ